MILDSVADGVFTVDGGWQITSFNRAAERITGVKRQDALGRRCCEVFRASICEGACALKHTLATGQPLVNKVVYILSAQGQKVPISVSTAILKDADGTVIGGVETFRDLRLVEELRKELESTYTFANIVARSPAMRRIFDLLPEIAASDSTVLIEGPSGTGKELFAQAIHNLSPRAKKRFVAINCGALPDTLLESELFGYKAGAFTDAKQDKPGRFALADGGTVFLDEIGDISPAMQARLLRVLQERVYEPLGSVQPVAADVRVVAASNKHLAKLVSKGTFREDLFYRINVVRLELPALRDRREDIPLLIEHFVAKFNRLQGKDIAGLADDVLAVLLAHDYPGNVRELENIIEHAFVLCRGGLVQMNHLPPQFRGDSTGPSFAPGATLESMERVMIADALRRHSGNRKAAATELGINPSTLFRKAKALGIDLPDKDGRSLS
ncbi:MAG: sigma-54 interaction domain-containing protein [Phycisphaerae bacterium]